MSEQIETTETTTAPKARKPRAPRKPKTVAPVEPPKCQQCGAVLGWRDYAYVGKDATMCKVCHQKSERKRLRGRFVPTTRIVTRNGKQESVPVRSNRALRRKGLDAASYTPAPPEPKAQRRSRASRRAQARKTAATQQQESAA